MGKTSQKLVIWVADEWLAHEKVKELADKGHSIEGIARMPDLILHPAAHQWTDEMWVYLENALKTARKRKYPRVKRKEK